MPALRWGASTSPGRVRSENEDTFVAEPLVFAVADGMGGHQAGEVASALAASIVRDRFGQGVDSEDAAVSVIAEANAAIFGASRANAAQTGMGTTLTALVVLVDDPAAEPERLVLLNIGDSRTYRFRFGRLQRVTVDHSYVQELVATGHITIEEARTHPRRNIVTRALGIEPNVRSDMWTLPIVRGDRFILCSDGLVDEVPDHEILDLVAAVDEPQVLADQLVEMANRHGGRDNVTVIVVDVLEGADPPDPTDEISFDPTWAEGTEEAAWADDAFPPPSIEVEDDALHEPASPTTQPVAITPPAMPPPPGQPRPVDGDEAVSDAAADGTATAPAAAAAATLAMASATPTLPPVTRTTPTAADEAVATTAVHTGGLQIDESVKVADPTADAAPVAGKPKKPKKSKGRRFTFGAFLFVFVLAAIVTVTFTLVAVHARSGYFVGFDGDVVVIYKGQRDNVLWFEPTIVERSTKTRQDLEPTMVDAISNRPTFDSAEDAAQFIDEQVIPTTTTVPDTSATSPTSVTSTDASTPPTDAGP